MTLHFHTFGALWFFGVIMCIAASALLVVMTNRLHLAGLSRVRVPLLAAAALEALIVIADLGIRIGARAPHEVSLVMLDAWTVARPLLHALTLALVALAVWQLQRRSH